MRSGRRAPQREVPPAAVRAGAGGRGGWATAVRAGAGGRGGWATVVRADRCLISEAVVTTTLATRPFAENPARFRKVIHVSARTAVPARPRARVPPPAQPFPPAPAPACLRRPRSRASARTAVPAGASARPAYALDSPMCPDSETFSASGVSLRSSMSTTPATATGMMAANIGTMASL